jgi:rubrerythrin
MESIQEDAFVTIIGIKIRSLIFYRAITSRVKDFKIKHFFETLAKEVTEHLKSFFDMLQFHENELATILVRSSTQAGTDYCSLIKSIDESITEKEALRIALMEERKYIRRYSSVVDSISEPHFREAFFKILIETEIQVRLITEEFLLLMKMEEKRFKGESPCRTVLAKH